MGKYITYGFLVLCMVAAINASGVVPPEFAEIAPEVRRICLEKTGVDVELVEKANLGEFIADPKLKCYLKCTLAQFGAVSKRGVNFEALTKLAPPVYKIQLEKGVAACKDRELYLEMSATRFSRSANASIAQCRMITS